MTFSIENDVEAAIRAVEKASVAVTTEGTREIAVSAYTMPDEDSDNDFDDDDVNEVNLSGPIEPKSFDPTEHPGDAAAFGTVVREGLVDTVQSLDTESFTSADEIAETLIGGDSFWLSMHNLMEQFDVVMTEARKNGQYYTQSKPELTVFVGNYLGMQKSLTRILDALGVSLEKSRHLQNNEVYMAALYNATTIPTYDDLMQAAYAAFNKVVTLNVEHNSAVSSRENLSQALNDAVTKNVRVSSMLTDAQAELKLLRAENDRLVKEDRLKQAKLDYYTRFVVSYPMGDKTVYLNFIVDDPDTGGLIKVKKVERKDAESYTRRDAETFIAEVIARRESDPKAFGNVKGIAKAALVTDTSSEK